MIYIIVASGKKKALDAINNSPKQYMQAKPRLTKAGDWVLNADILTDPKNFGAHHATLKGCQTVELDPDKDFDNSI